MSKAQRDPFRAIKSTKEDGNKLPFPVAIALTDLFYLLFYILNDTTVKRFVMGKR